MCDARGAAAWTPRSPTLAVTAPATPAAALVAAPATGLEVRRGHHHRPSHNGRRGHVHTLVRDWTWRQCSDGDGLRNCGRKHRCDLLPRERLGLRLGRHLNQLLGLRLRLRLGLRLRLRLGMRLVRRHELQPDGLVAGVEAPLPFAPALLRELHEDLCRRCVVAGRKRREERAVSVQGHHVLHHVQNLLETLLAEKRGAQRFVEIAAVIENDVRLGKPAVRVRHVPAERLHQQVELVPQVHQRPILELEVREQRFAATNIAHVLH
mmetsp:Transcript_89290/g.251309  ORF Transcript_89290/g.251309 Transcript_89290/m.251309 type:complete len:265 (+) Transcript_89290:226-1020(+)